MSRSNADHFQGEFVCHRCGNCCRGDGFVQITNSDLERAAAYLGIGRQEFLDTYCQLEVDGAISLRDQDDAEQSCIFLTEEEGLFGCRIHGEKPTQCAGFPFTWRPKDLLDFCHGARAASGLPPAPPDGRRKMTN